ncbi:MAG: helix-turn-helix domain-containing protein [Tannerella sp.]|jgi:DNA-binding XRE family transcriptional regulator|nr:helix-turn-helix domain-containing protein [Tannerella sp.]
MKEDDERKERIVMIMNEADMNPTQFSNAIGVQRAALSHIMAGRNNPSLDVVTKILKRFDSISTDWLLFGKGEMKRDRRHSPTPPVHDLFSQHPVASTLREAHVADKTAVKDEKIEVKAVENVMPAGEIAENKPVAEKIIPAKTIDKLLIFYSDNTYETFVTEKQT